MEKRDYVKPAIDVIEEDAECSLLAGSPPPRSTNSTFAPITDPATGDNNGGDGVNSSASEATGHGNGTPIGSGDGFAKGWDPVGMDVLDSL